MHNPLTKAIPSPSLCRRYSYVGTIRSLRRRYSVAIPTWAWVARREKENPTGRSEPFDGFASAALYLGRVRSVVVVEEYLERFPATPLAD